MHNLYPWTSLINKPKFSYVITLGTWLYQFLQANTWPAKIEAFSWKSIKLTAGRPSYVIILCILLKRIKLQMLIPHLKVYLKWKVSDNNIFYLSVGWILKDRMILLSWILIWFIYISIFKREYKRWEISHIFSCSVHTTGISVIKKRQVVELFQNKIYI